MSETKATPPTGSTEAFFGALNSITDSILRGVATDAWAQGRREGVDYFYGGLEDWPPRVAAEILHVPLPLFVKMVGGQVLLTNQELAYLLSETIFQGLNKKTQEDLSHLHAEASREEKSAASRRKQAATAQYYGEPPVHQVDGSGNIYKPAVRRVRTPEEFIGAMIAFREWAGGPEELTSRKLAHWSGGVFSHSTINRILSLSLPFENKPVVKLRYVSAFIEACGGTTGDVKEWNTAWRRAYKKLSAADTMLETGDDVDRAALIGRMELELVTTREDLLLLLNKQHAHAGKPSLRVMAKQIEKLDDKPVGIATLSDMLNGRRTPRKSLMLAFLRAYGVQNEAELNAWANALYRVQRAEDQARQAVQ